MGIANVVSKCLNLLQKKEVAQGLLNKFNSDVELLLNVFQKVIDQVYVKIRV